MSNKKLIYEVLKEIVDPAAKKDIVELGCIEDLTVSDSGDVRLVLCLSGRLDAMRDQTRDLIVSYLNRLDFVKHVSVDFLGAKTEAKASAQSAGFNRVKRILAVSSCKGGVGKSTVACNLAFALAKSGKTVGLFDADIYGPSLPTLIDVNQELPMIEDDRITPLEYEGVKLMSFGYVQHQMGEDGPAVMRGPMVSQVVHQLLSATEWGDLDYLVLDLPPGTGDIPITLAQLLPISASIIVTTPQEISFVDVVKGIEMFDKLNVPVVGVVENMSYFVCDSCDKKHRIFGVGALRRLKAMFGFKNLFELPMLEAVSAHSDAGIPFVLKNESSLYSETFDLMAKELDVEIGFVEELLQKIPKVGVEDSKLTIEFDGQVRELLPFDVRVACQCAHCVDEFSGNLKLDVEAVDRGIQVTQFKPVGNYAVALDWSDGHSSLVPYQQLLGMG